MQVGERLKDKREKILAIAERYGAHNVRIFGSAARGEAGPESDIDFLVDVEDTWTLWDHVGMKQDLEDLLGYRVDAIIANTLRDIARDSVLRCVCL